MITAKLSLPHTTKKFSDREDYVNHSSEWISWFFPTRSPLILKFYTLDIQAPCLLEIYHPSYIPVALEAIENKMYSFMLLDIALTQVFRSPTVREETSVVCTKVVLFMEQTICSWLARSPVWFGYWTAKTIPFKWCTGNTLITLRILFVWDFTSIKLNTVFHSTFYTVRIYTLFNNHY